MLSHQHLTPPTCLPKGAPWEGRAGKQVLQEGRAEDKHVASGKDSAAHGTQMRSRLIWPRYSTTVAIYPHRVQTAILGWQHLFALV